MATFNSMPSAIQSGASPNDALGLNAAGALGPNSLGIQAFDQELNFDDGMLDNVNGGLHGLPFTPTYDFDNFTTTFEDPFHYPKPYDVAPEPGAYPDDEGSSPQQLDDKLLGFSAVAVKAQPVDDATGTLADVGMSAELYGMFFVAEDVFGGEATGAARPLELTCYRRNLWQCSGQIAMPRHCAQVVNEQGRAVPIVEFYAAISAAESIEGKPTEIISIPWKSSAGHPAGLGEGQETKTAGPPPKIPLDLLGGPDVADGHGHRVTLPVSWKRLQFKSATANNGRRKGLQQHYVVRISLLGRMKVNGELMKIAEIQSGPVIVRGRSPRNFDGRKDVPLSGEKKASGSSSSSGGGSTTSHGERQRSHTHDIPTATPKQERAEVPQNLHQFQQSVGSSSLHASSGSGDWPAPTYGGQSQPSQQHPAKKMSMSPNPSRPPVPSWSREQSSSSSGGTNNKPKPASLRNQSSPAVPSMPISLSLSEDERSPNHNANHRSSMSDVLQSPTLHRAGTAGSLYHGHSSPYEEAEQLYEYFPLSVDDWTPLVDTVYRPHIVHHIAVPQEIKAQKVRSKAKRYFSAE